MFQHNTAIRPFLLDFPASPPQRKHITIVGTHISAGPTKEVSICEKEGANCPNRESSNVAALLRNLYPYNIRIQESKSASGKGQNFQIERSDEHRSLLLQSA